jgi:DNA-binding MarR family transcriptional regulator
MDPRHRKVASSRPPIEVGIEQETEWPGSSALATSCVLNIATLSARIVAYGLRIVRAHGIPSVAAFNVLTVLHGESGRLLPSTIADRMIVTRGTVTGILDSLERRRLIRRTRHGTDGRRRLVQITPKGRARVEAILPLLHEAERRWMDALTPVQQRQLLRLIGRVHGAGPDRLE